MSLGRGAIGVKDRTPTAGGTHGARQRGRARGRLDAFAGRHDAAIVAPDGEIAGPETLPWGGTYIGPEGFGEFLAGCPRTSTSSRPRPQGPRRRRQPRDRGREVEGRTKGGGRSRIAPSGSTSCATARSPTRRPSATRRRSCEARGSTAPDPASRSSSSPTTSRGRGARALPALSDQLRGGDELIVVDNDSADGTRRRRSRELAPGATVIETGANLGLRGGCNRGAAGGDRASCSCFLNPDAVPRPAGARRSSAPLADGRGWAAWQALVTARGRPRGQHPRRRGPLHRHRLGRRRRRAGRPRRARRTAAPAPSRASSPAPAWRSRERFLGGRAASPRSSSSTTRTSTSRFGCGSRADASGSRPRARVDHDYEFEKGPAKWRHLERNRWATLIRTYPAALLALLAAGAAWPPSWRWSAISIAGGWFGAEGCAPGPTRSLGLPRLLARAARDPGAARDRRGRVRPPRSPPASTRPTSGGRRARALLRAALRAYWRVVLALLGGRGR